MQEAFPLVSVIIPAYNSASFLNRTIESVLKQTYPNFELLVIDDGSTDSTKELIKVFTQLDKRIKYYWQPNSGGAANPKNNAFLLCSGKYIAYLDHDDEWMPEKLSSQVKVLESSNDKIGLVTCHALIHSGEQKPNFHKVKALTEVELFLNHPSDYIFSNSSVILPRTVIEAVGERDETLKIYEDFDYFIRVIQKGFLIKFVDEPLLKYYFHDSNLTHSKNRLADYELFLKKHNATFLLQGNETRANYYRHLGTINLCNKRKLKSIRFFVQAIKCKPSLRNITTFIASIMLGYKMYEKVLNFKSRIVIKYFF